MAHDDRVTTRYGRRRYRPFTLVAVAGLTVLLSVFNLATIVRAQLTTVAQGDARTLLQADGSTELVERFRLALPVGVNPSDVEYFQTSSNPDCLDVTKDRNIIPTRTGNYVNVTSTLTFDKLPGVTKYTLGVRRRGTDTVLYEETITYTVVGLALYTKKPDGGINVVSGDSNFGYQVPYEKAAKKQVDPEDRIYAFIQYADGTNSDNLPQSTQRLPLGNTLVPKVESSLDQFTHAPERCNPDTIGTYSSADGVLLPAGCGFGFYRDAPGNLLFGFKWNPYRVGPLRLHFSWPGLTAVSTDLSEESFETNLKAEVVGSPPIVVTKVEPTDSPLFRTEGGQPVQVTFVNGALKPINDMRIQIAPGTFAKLVPGSISPIQEPDRIQTATFVVEPGTGGPYDAIVQYQEPGSSGSPTPTPGTSGSPTTPPSTTGSPTTPPGTTGTPTSSGTPAPGTSGNPTTPPGTSGSLTTPGTTGAPSTPPSTSGTPTTPPGKPGTPAPGSEPWQDAIMNVPFKPAYDEKTLFIETMTPTSGSEEGNTPITLIGYFSNFEPNRDSVSFSGIKLPASNIESATPDSIKFKLPPRSSLGSAPEYEVTVSVGNGISNRVRFFYLVDPSDVTVQITSTGTTNNGGNRYRVSSCTPVRFTAINTPTTKQVKKLEWSLTSGEDLGTDLFKTKPEFKSVDTSAGTIELQPEQFGKPGSYILTATFTLEGGTVKDSVVLVRDEVPAPGVTLLKVPKRYMSLPMAPVRVNAVITSPGACYTGDQALRFEWTVFGEKYDFMPSDATGNAKTPPDGVHPARLGRELIIPQNSLKPGVHNVTLNVWLGNSTEPSGTASTTFEVITEALIPVIRNGEAIIETNTVTDLEIFGTNSYDPDVFGPDKTGGITYKWTCFVSETANFSKKEKCPGPILPDNAVSSPAFTVPKDEVAKLNDKVNYIRYGLETTKGAKKEITTMDARVIPNGSKPMLLDYVITLEDSDGNPINPTMVPTYYTVVLKPTSPKETKWTYEVIEPTTQDFQFANMLAKSPTMYSPEEKDGSTKPLGFAPNKLSSFTTYKVKVSFPETAATSTTSVVYEFKTMETPRLGLLKPAPSEGDTTTVFTVSAGLPIPDDRFAYYFFVTDSEGNEVCVGGCTGHHITYFQLFTPGTYTLTTRLFDKRGFSLLDEKILPKPLLIKPSGNEKDTIKLLPFSFKTGDDATWVQVANDLSIAAADNSPSRAALEMIFGRPYEQLANSGVLRPNNNNAIPPPTASVPSPEATPESTPGPTPEGNTPVSGGGANGQPGSSARGGNTAGGTNEQYGQERNAARTLAASGIRKIICSTTPNAQMGRNALMLVLRTLSAPYVSASTWYDLLFITKCAIENASPSDAIAADDILPTILGSLYKHAERLDSQGITRSRLRSNGPIGSLSSDAATIVGRLMVRAFGVGKLDGFKMTKELGPGGKFGYVSMFVGSKPEQMEEAKVNGQPRRVLKGRTNDEVFYIHSARYSTVFAPGPNSKRFVLLHSAPNFVLNSHLQPEPVGGNLGDYIYWAQIYGLANNGGRMQRLRPTSAEPAFCMRIPVTNKNKFFASSVSRMPGMYSHKNIKPLGVDVSRKGEYFNYDYSGIKVIEYDVTEKSGWVEACHTAPNLFGATSVSKATDGAARSIGLQGAVLSGDNGVLIPYIAGGACILAMLMILIAWLVAIKSGGDGGGGGGGGGSAFVDRDANGRQAAAALNGVAPVATPVAAT